jgi:predicted transcriptional regulator
MATSIQISEELKKVLSKKKLSERETYENIIWNLLEDNLELNEQTRKELEESRKEIKEGKIITLAQLKKELNIE